MRTVFLLTLALVPAPGWANPADPDRARELVRKLGAADFRSREQATRELLTLGRHAFAALADGVNHPQLEVRTRCRRLLPRAFDLDLNARVEAFISDTDGIGSHDLPGWSRWKAILGTSRASRDLYVAAVRADGRLMNDIEERLQEYAIERFVARCAELQQRLQPQPSGKMPGQATAGDLAQLLFLGTNPDLDVSSQVCSQVNQFLYRPTVREWFATGEASAHLRTLLVNWLKRNINESNTGYTIANLMNSLKLPELTDLAFQVVSDNKALPNVRANLIVAFGRQNLTGAVAHLHKITTDPTPVSQFAIGQKRMTTQLGDVALAMAIHLSGHRPADYGYEGLTTQAGIFSYYRLGFASDTERHAARAMWQKQFAKSKPGP